MPFLYIVAFGATVMQIASIIPAKAKFVRKKAAQHFINDFIDFAPKATKTIKARNVILIIKFRKCGIFSIKIIRENNPPIADAVRKRTGLNWLPVIAALALRSR